MVGTVCFISWSNILVAAVEIFSLAKYSCSIGVQNVLLGIHNVHGLFYFVMQNSQSSRWKFWACRNILSQLDCRLFCQPCMVGTVCAILWRKVCAQVSLNFEHVQIVLISWIVDFYVQNEWCALSYLSAVQNCCYRHFKLVQIILINWIADCFVRHTWCAL